MVEYLGSLIWSQSIMKKFFITIFTLSILLFGGSELYAQEEPILFWGVNCPYCHVVRKKLDEEKLREKVEINEVEIQKETGNAELFKEKVQICGLDSEEAGVPMLFVDGKCYQGVGPIMDKLRFVASSAAPVQEESEEVENVEESSKASLIWIGAAVLIALPVLAFFLKEKKGEKKKKK